MADNSTQVKVVALSDIRHGADDGTITTFVEGDEITLTVREARPLIQAGVVKASDAVVEAVKSVDETEAAAETPTQPSEADITQTLADTQV